jgi:hypothetical protein
MTRQNDGITRVLNRGCRLHEQNGTFWHGNISFRGMASVIQSDAEDVCGRYWSEQFIQGRLAGGDREVAVDVPVDLEGNAIGLERSMTDGAVRSLESDQFHFVGERLRREARRERGDWLFNNFGKMESGGNGFLGGFAIR